MLNRINIWGPHIKQNKHQGSHISQNKHQDCLMLRKTGIQGVLNLTEKASGGLILNRISIQEPLIEHNTRQGASYRTKIAISGRHTEKNKH